MITYCQKTTETKTTYGRRERREYKEHGVQDHCAGSGRDADQPGQGCDAQDKGGPYEGPGYGEDRGAGVGAAYPGGYTSGPGA